MEPEQWPKAVARTVYDSNVAKGYARQHCGDSYAAEVYQFSHCTFNGTCIGERFTVVASTAPQEVPVVQRDPVGGSCPPKARSRLSLARDAVPRPAERRIPEIPTLAAQGIDQPELRNATSEVCPPQARSRLSVVRDAVPRPLEKGIPEIPALAPKEINQPEPSSSRLQIPRKAQTRRPLVAEDDSVCQPAPVAEHGAVYSPSMPTVRADCGGLSKLIADAKARSTRLTSNTVDIPNRDGMMEQDGTARNFGTGIYRAKYAYSWKSMSGQGYLREGELVLVGVEDENSNYCTKVTGICEYELGETAWISKRGLLEKAISTKTNRTARYNVKVKMKDHLAVSKGDVVEIYGKRGRTWLVKLGDAYGIVPASAFEFDMMEFLRESRAPRLEGSGDSKE
ncbi:hypothetical protein HII31_07896 [Pseudocercospora fuligena]|uniref:SH3 domain-containing protein n=1 Tax=Pseudocercospora fuligena TaxID=685502 RepID=A0A8H6VHJ7_9PEZI|nr:hypothetical protein HII31_07896 [Pseudocercospora fuligena]